MSVLDVVNYGNPILRKKCKQVTDFSNLTSFIEDMFDTMYEEEGIGLAANQVGVDMNMFIIDIAHTCLLYTSPSPRDRTRSRMPSSA